MARKKKVAIVEEDNNLVRDLSTNAIINTNSNAIRARRAQMNLASQQAEKILVLEEELAELKKAIKKLSK